MNSLLEQAFSEKLQKLFKKKVALQLKNNRCVFLHAKKIEKNKLDLILHRAFLQAPDSILFSMKDFVLSGKKEALKELQHFMEYHFQKNDYSHLMDRKKLKTHGKYYNLKKILSNLSNTYFQRPLDLSISWFPAPFYRRFSSITFGSYDKAFRLIKINDLLDDAFFPAYFVSFIVYHEILHSIYPIVVDTNGRRRIHTKDFCIAEKRYLHYELAKIFEKKFLKQRKQYVRT